MNLSADRTRAINRIRAQALAYFPALERALDYSVSKAALILLTGSQTPASLRRIGRARLATWFKNHGVRTLNVVKNAAGAAVHRGRGPVHCRSRGEDRREDGPHAGEGGDRPR